MKMENKSIWSPVTFDPKWNECQTEKFDNIYPSWGKRRAELNKSPEQYNQFIDQLKRKQAIDTGIIERMYDLKKGITETFIREGFVESYLQHGDTDVAPNVLMSYLKDNFSAMDFIFDFAKNNRLLSVSYIKELHALITQHQDTTEAVDQFGNHIAVKMLKGAFKINPNNPVRDDAVYGYCPPEQVDSEMDNLIEIFNSQLMKSHVLVKAAFLHHAFVQIHPFQDGNGRIARLLASLVLIKEGLFPLSIDRNDRTKYIDALEIADKHEYQALVNVFAQNQISSIERALNWKIVENAVGYDSVLSVLGRKLTEYRISEAEQLNKQILEHMTDIFMVIQSAMQQYVKDLKEKLSVDEIKAVFCPPDGARTYYYTKQIVSYANEYDYYVNLSLKRCWGGMSLNLDKNKKYRVIISLHHYGYDKSTFAIGAFLSKQVIDKSTAQTVDDFRKEYIDVPLGVPPLTMSSDKEIAELKSSITQQIELSIMAALSYIANEL